MLVNTDKSTNVERYLVLPSISYCMLHCSLFTLWNYMFRFDLIANRTACNCSQSSLSQSIYICNALFVDLRNTLTRTRLCKYLGRTLYFLVRVYESRYLCRSTLTLYITVPKRIYSSPTRNLNIIYEILYRSIS